MAESNAQRATRAAYECIEARLLALRSRTEEGAGGYVVKELARLVNCIVQLRGNSPPNQHRISSESAPNQLDAQGPSLGEGGDKGGVDSTQKLKKKPSPNRSYRRTEYSEDFIAFWGVYPKYRRTQKPDCFKLWKELPVEIRRAAYKNAKMRAASDTKWLEEGGKYVPAPLQYLKHEGWEDAWQSTKPGGDSLEDRARAMAAKYDEPYEKMLKSLQESEANRG